MKPRYTSGSGLTWAQQNGSIKRPSFWQRLRPAGEPWWHIWAGIIGTLAVLTIAATGVVVLEPEPTFQEAQP